MSIYRQIKQHKNYVNPATKLQRRFLYQYCDKFPVQADSFAAGFEWVGHKTARGVCC